MNIRKKVPQIRFPGFEGEWEERKLNSLLDERHEFSTACEEYPRLSFTIEDGVIDPEDRKTNKRDFLIKDEANKKYLITEYNDIIYNPANVVYGAIHRNKKGKGCLSPIYRIFTTSQVPLFMEYLVRRDSFIRTISQLTEGTVVKLRTLKPEAFLKCSVLIPVNIEEQKKIGALFQLIDEYIQNIDDGLNHWKIIKRSMLNKMFPMKGSNVPQVRFSGFSDPWIIHKLGSITDNICNGYSYKTDGNRDHRYKITRIESISSGEINIEKLGSTDFIDENYRLIDGDILFSHINSLPQIANTAIYTDNLGIMYHGMNLLRIRANKEIVDCHYLFHVLKREESREWFRMVSKRAVNQCSIAISDVDKFELFVPSVQEQKMISMFFDGVDYMITLHQYEIEKWKKLKKCLLQQMFIM